MANLGEDGMDNEGDKLSFGSRVIMLCRGRDCMSPEMDRHRGEIDLCRPVIWQLEVGDHHGGPATIGSNWVETFVAGNDICKRKGVFICLCEWDNYVVVDLHLVRLLGGNVRAWYGVLGCCHGCIDTVKKEVFLQRRIKYEN